MRRVPKSLGLLLYMLAISPIFAQSADPLVDATAVAVDPLTVAPPGTSIATELDASNLATVVSDPASPAECLAPVAIKKIDGIKRVVAAKGFVIEAGIHTLNGQALLDTSVCPINDKHLQIKPAEDLQVFFEPGGIYHVAYDHASDNPDEWRLVVWKAELPVPSIGTMDNQTRDPTSFRGGTPVQR